MFVGKVSTLYTAAGSLFNSTMGIAVDSNGILYVADTNNNAIKTISSGTTVSIDITGCLLPSVKLLYLLKAVLCTHWRIEMRT